MFLRRVIDAGGLQKRLDLSSVDSNVQVTMLFSNLKLDVSGLLRVEAGCEVAENMVTEVE